MTITIGKLIPGGCILGSDSQITENHIIHAVPGGKLTLLLPGIWAAWAGTTLIREPIVTAAKKARRRDKLPVVKFVDTLRARLDTIRWDPLSEEEDRDGSPYWDLAVLLTDGHRLVEVTCNLSAEDVARDRYVCHGSGCDVAYGAVAAAARFLPDSPEEVIRLAIEETCQMHATCGPPVIVRRVPRSRDVRLA